MQLVLSGVHHLVIAWFDVRVEGDKLVIFGVGDSH